MHENINISKIFHLLSLFHSTTTVRHASNLIRPLGSFSPIVVENKDAIRLELPMFSERNAILPRPFNHPFITNFQLVNGICLSSGLPVESAAMLTEGAKTQKGKER